MRTGLRVVLVLTALCVPGAGHATNGDQMLGANAMQWGMAGAVTAEAQDAATVFVNPAGLNNLDIQEVQFDMGFGLLNPPRNINGRESDSDFFFIPSGAVAFRIDDRTTLGLGMAGLSGLGVDVPDALPSLPGNQAIVTTKQFFRLAPSIARRIGERLSVGASFNINYHSLALQTPTFSLPQNQKYGYGATLGMTYRINDQFQLGASYLTRQQMQAFEWNTAAGRYSLDLDAAPQLAFGLGWRPSDDLLLEFDVKHIWFSDVQDRETLVTPTGNSTLAFGWENQTVFAFAVQKVLNASNTVRAGFNFMESPIAAEDVDGNLGSLAVVESHLSLGWTRRYNRKVSSTFSFVHGFENSVTSNSGSGNTIEMRQNVLHFMITYRN